MSLSKALVKQFSWLVSAALFAHVLNFLFLPLLLRLFSPTAFGEAAAFSALLLLLSPLAVLCLPQALVLARNLAMVRHLSILTLLSALLACLLLCVVLLTLKNTVLSLSALEAIGSLIWLLPIGLWVSANLQLAQQTLIRRQAFRALAKADFLQVLLLNCSRFVWGFWQNTAGVLISLLLCSQALQTYLLRRAAPASVASPSSIFSVLASRRGRLQLLATVKRFKAFILYQTPQALLNAAAQGVPILLLAACYDSATAGFYALAKAVLAVPASLLGKAVGDVFYPHFSKLAQGQQPLLSALVKTQLLLMVVGIVPFGVFMLAGEPLFSLVFGAQWSASGLYAGWMAFWLYFAFVNTPAVKAAMVLHIQQWSLLLNCLTLGLRLGALYWFASRGAAPELAIAAFAAVGALHCMLFSGICWFFCNKKQQGVTT